MSLASAAGRRQGVPVLRAPSGFCPGDPVPDGCARRASIRERSTATRGIPMAHDVLDPGPDGTYPYFPRHLDGSPDYDRTGYKDPALPYAQRQESQKGVGIDLTCPVVPPTVDPTTLPGGVAR